jgi:hypothetical protein
MLLELSASERAEQAARKDHLMPRHYRSLTPEP